MLLLFLKSDERCHEVSREGGGLLAGVGGLRTPQVWQLTQFYYVSLFTIDGVLFRARGSQGDPGSQGNPGSQARGDTGPPIFGIRKTIAFSSNAQSRFQAIVLDSALEPWHLARHT